MSKGRWRSRPGADALEFGGALSGFDGAEQEVGDRRVVRGLFESARRDPQLLVAIDDKSGHDAGVIEQNFLDASWHVVGCNEPLHSTVILELIWRSNHGL